MRVTKFDVFILVLAGIDFGVAITPFSEGRWEVGYFLVLMGIGLICLVIFSAMLKR